jgi:hypothetical protein
MFTIPYSYRETCTGNRVSKLTHRREIKTKGRNGFCLFFVSTIELFKITGFIRAKILVLLSNKMVRNR